MQARLWRARRPYGLAALARTAGQAKGTSVGSTLTCKKGSRPRRHRTDAVQVGFLLVPAADDVEPGAPVRDVIDGRDRLGRERRRDQRHMDGREHADLLGERSDGRSASRCRGSSSAIPRPSRSPPPSSGHHAQRRTILELQVTNGAIKSIKRRHGFARLNMYGQSGGASLIGSLLAMRDDLNCAVPGSGRLVALPSSIEKNKSIADAALAIINPYSGIGEIARKSTAKIMLVTDPDDAVVMRRYQDPFVWALRDGGRHVDQFYVSAIDPEHHGVVKYAAAAMRECIRGSNSDQVATELANVARKIAEARSQSQPQTS